MNQAVLEYHRVLGVGWLFGIVFSSEIYPGTDRIVGETGYTARELPFEIIAQLCWQLSASAGGEHYFNGFAEVFVQDSHVRGFAAAAEANEPGTFIRKGGRKIFFPAGLTHLRELLKPDSPAPRVTINEPSVEVAMTLGRFGWTIRPDENVVLPVLQPILSTLSVQMCEFDKLKSITPGENEFETFDV